MKKILTFLFISLYGTNVLAHAYNGSPDWHAPKNVICSGLPDFPKGLKFSPHQDQVFGASLDSYIFINMDGAMGIYYFQMSATNKPNFIKGTATYISSSGWVNKDYEVECKVTEWYNK